MVVVKLEENVRSKNLNHIIIRNVIKSYRNWMHFRKALTPINLKLTIHKYCEALIMNMMMKIRASLIFNVKTEKKCFLQVFLFYVDKY